MSRHTYRWFRMLATCCSGAALWLLLVAVLLSTVPAQASILGAWTINGPGSTSVDTQGNQSIMGFALFQPDGSPQTWIASAPILQGGRYEAVYSYQGLFDVPDPEVSLSLLGPDVLLEHLDGDDCCPVFAGEFSLAGSVMVDLVAGETLSFAMSGGAGGPGNAMIGSLSVQVAPLPPSFLMLIAAVAMTAFIAHRGRQSDRVLTRIPDV